MRALLTVVAVVGMAVAAAGQTVMPATGTATAFQGASMPKPPAGSTVAIVEFEDLECPLCALTAPVVWAAEQQYHVPRVHRDLIIPGHTWSRAAAVDARYLEDTVSPGVAEAFRRDVFAHQAQIAGPEDLQGFAAGWFRAHGVAMPFVMDPTGRCAAEVQADCLLGQRLGVRHTPTLLVVTATRWIEVTDRGQLGAAGEQAQRWVKEDGAGGGARKGRGEGAVRASGG